MQTFKKTVWGNEPHDVYVAVASALSTTFQELDHSRQNIEQVWLMAWALYLNTNESMQAVRAKVTDFVGDVGTDWRHRINKGKAFSEVETVHSYMMQAQFPSRRWFNAVPTDSDHKLEAKAITQYVSEMLDRNDYTSRHDIWLRQLIITGTSVMGLPYRYDTIKQRYRRKVNIPINVDANGVVTDEKVMYMTEEEPDIIKGSPDFEVVNTLDVYLDPNNANPNDERSPFMRVVRKRRSEVIRLMKQGQYKMDIEAVMHASSVSTIEGSERLKQYEGINVTNAASMSDMIELYEYWGDLHLDGVTYHDVFVLAIKGGQVLKFEPNPYWSGRPYVIAQYVPTVNQPYAIGALQPSLGLLSVDNNLLNHRLDAIELSIDPMYEVSADSGIDDEELFSEPGKVFRTTELNSFRPIPTGDKAYTITYQEQGFLDNSISANTGTPSLISTGQVRGGERVTAAEIQSIKDAGGNRLSGVFARIETTAVYPMLRKVLRMLQQYSDETLVVNIQTRLGDGSEAVAFVEVSPEDLQARYDLVPLGSNHVIEREQFIQQRVELLGIASQIPEMMQKLDTDAILEDIVGAFGFENPDRYIKMEESASMDTTEAAGPPLTPEMEASQELAAMGGQSFADAMAVEGGGNPAVGVQQVLAQ